VVRYTLPSRGLSPLKVLPAFPGAPGVLRCFGGRVVAEVEDLIDLAKQLNSARCMALALHVV